MPGVPPAVDLRSDHGRFPHSEIKEGYWLTFAPGFPVLKTAPRFSLRPRADRSPFILEPSACWIWEGPKQGLLLLHSGTQYFKKDDNGVFSNLLLREWNPTGRASPDGLAMSNTVMPFCLIRPITRPRMHWRRRNSARNCEQLFSISGMETCHGARASSRSDRIMSGYRRSEKWPAGCRTPVAHTGGAAVTAEVELGFPAGAG